MQFFQKQLCKPQRLVFKMGWEKPLSKKQIALINEIEKDTLKDQERIKKIIEIKEADESGEIDYISKKARLDIAILNATKTQKLEKLATIDGLTGLYNRRYFDKQFPKEIAKVRRKGPPVSTLMLDLDKFKNTNDTFGHDAGDEVLKKFADIIKKACRTEDIPCRYGGEEFIIILPSTEKEGALIVAERIRNAIESEKIEYDGEIIPTTTSIGVTTKTTSELWKDNKKEANKMQKEADHHLYIAKEFARNCVVEFNIDGGYICYKGDDMTFLDVNKEKQADGKEKMIVTKRDLSFEQEFKEAQEFIKRPKTAEGEKEVEAA